MKNMHINTKRIMFVSIILSIPLLLYSCISSEGNIGFPITGYNVPARENGIGFKGIKYKIIPLERNDEFALVSPKKIEIVDSTILVLVGNKVVSYNLEGKYLYTIDHVGHGHNEYINLSTFYVDNDGKVTLLDSYKNMLFRFNKDGQFLDVKKVSPIDLKYAQSILPINKDSLFVYNFLYNDFNQLCRTINLKSKTEYGITSIPLHTNNTMEYVGKSPYSVYKGTIRYLKPFDNHIYNLTENTTLNVETTDKIFSKKEIEEIKDFSIATYADCLNNGIFTGFTDIFETKNYIILACHNITYLLIDKRKMTCQRIEYTPSTNYKSIPLYNIKSSSGNQLIGLLSKEEVEEVTTNKGNKIIQTLKKYLEKRPFDQAIIVYDIENVNM